MPVSYHINQDEGLITIRAQQHVDFAHLLETADAMLADPGFDSRLPQLVDLRGMNLKFCRSAEKAFNRFVVNEFGGDEGGSIAVVIDDDLDSSQCAAIFRLACAVRRAELFDSYEHALRWLIRQEFVPTTSTRHGVSEAGYDAAVVAELLQDAGPC